MTESARKMLAAAKRLNDRMDQQQPISFSQIRDQALALRGRDGGDAAYPMIDLIPRLIDALEASQQSAEKREARNGVLERLLWDRTIPITRDTDAPCWCGGWNTPPEDPEGRVVKRCDEWCTAVRAALTQTALPASEGQL